METYQCNTCGKMSHEKKTLCNITVPKTTYVCEDPHKHNTDISYFCKPREITPEYFCTSCGKVSDTKAGLCKAEKVISK